MGLFIYLLFIYYLFIIYLYLFIFFYLFIHSFIHLFIYGWLCWVFVSVPGLSLVAASGDHSSSQCAGLSLSRRAGLSLSQPLLLRSTGSRRASSVSVAHGPSCSAACGIFPDQGSNPCSLHWQADSQPLHHQGSPIQVLEGNIGKTLFDINHSKIFFDPPPRVTEIKTKINKCN